MEYRLKILSVAAGLFLALFASGCGKGGGGGSGEPDSPYLETSRYMEAGTTAGPFFVDVPEGAASLTIIADGGDTSDMDISSLIDPTGRRMMTDGLNDPMGRNMAQAAGQSVVTITIPHGGDYAFTPGRWSFDVTHYASPGGGRDVSVYTIVKEAEGSELSLNLWLVGMEGLSSEEEAALETIMDEAERLAAAAGIRISRTERHTVTGEDGARLTYIDLDADDNSNGQPDGMDELFRLSADAGNDYVNIFFVRYIGQGVIGYSGGIPGPPLIQGTAHSGVIVSTFGGFSNMTRADLEMQGATIAHEAGHYLGLFHTTERSGVEFDPISDTPECARSEYDKNGDGIVSSRECRGVDGPNLMFWSAASYPQETLTETQGRVLRLSPAVK